MSEIKAIEKLRKFIDDQFVISGQSYLQGMAIASSIEAEIAELQERVDNLCASEEIGNKLIAQLLDSDREKNRRIVEYAEKVGELEAENAELKSRHCPHYHVKEHYCDVHETRIAELLAKVDALEADKRNWQDGYYLARLTELEEENEKLKEELRLVNTYSGIKGCECETTVFGMKLDEVRNLQVENAKLREKLDAYETREAEEADELLVKYENLKKRVVELEADNTKWVDENITLRANLSKALDHAHSISKLGELD